MILNNWQLNLYALSIEEKQGMSDTPIGESNTLEQVQGDNIQAFYDLLNSIEQSSSDQKDKGTRFENLVLDFGSPKKPVGLD